jgi:TATA-box binding protein (TBP) (component of TFIID and TFIIIB)
VAMGDNCPIVFRSFSICNIVSSFDVGRKIDLAALYYSRPKNCNYIQEIFPGLKYTPFKDENVVAIIFDSGRVNITGAKTMEKIEQVYELVNRILLRYRI